jgi:hypothetical protein
MTIDEFEQERVNIKKKGLSPYVEDHLMAKLRHKYYTALIDKQEMEISERLLNNMRFLNRIHKSKLSMNNMTDYMGLRSDKYLNATIIEGKLVHFKYILWIAAYFGIPSELLLYTDLEANEGTIKAQYPALFK